MEGAWSLAAVVTDKCSSAETQESEELLSTGTSVVAVERLSAETHESRKALLRDLSL